MGKKLKTKRPSAAKGPRVELKLREQDYIRLEKNLRDTDFFSSMTAKDRSMILPYMRLFSYPKKSVIFREGSMGDHFYLIYDGKVDVYKHGNIFKGALVKLATLTRGEFFGEMALLFNQPRTADCVAQRGARVFQLSKEDFQRILRRSPAVLRKVRRVVEVRLKKLSQTLYY